MFACSPGSVGLAGHSNWGSKGFDETDHSLFREAANMVGSVPEGKRIIKTLEDVEVTFQKAYLGSGKIGLDLGKIGHTETDNSIFSGQSAVIQIDLYTLRKNLVPASHMLPVLAWVIFHELRHVEAAHLVGGDSGRAINRNLDFYFYPSEDPSEKEFISQAKIPFKAGENGKMVYPTAP